MLASSRRKKPKLTLRDQERFLSKKRAVDKKNQERRESLQEVKKSEDFLRVTVNRPLADVLG